MSNPLFFRRRRRTRQPVASLTLPGTPLAVYSLVKTPSWGGACIRIKRSSDSAQTDIGFVNSYCNMAAAFAFAAGSTITVVTWYDQSGNGYDATATTAAPTIYSGNTVQGLQPLTFCQSVGFGNPVKMDLPAGLAVSTRDFTACVAAAGGGGWLNFNSLFSLGTEINLWYEKSTGVWQGNSLFTSGDKKLFSPRQAQVDSVILSGSASQRILRNNGNSQTVGSAYTLATTAGGSIGTSSVVSTTAQEIFAYVIYGTAISAGDKALVEAAFTTAFKANTPAYTSKIVYMGDSITAGFTTDAYLYGYPRVVNSINGQGAAIYNIAVPGQTMATNYTNRAHTTARYDAAYANNVNMIFAGTNDIANRASGTIVGYGTTVWTDYLLPYIQAVQAAGFNHVLVGTIIDRTWTGSGTDISQKETERLAYNTLIRDNALTYGYTVVDFASLSEMSDSTNTTYFVDGVHPTRLGYNVMGIYAAPYVANATNAGIRAVASNSNLVAYTTSTTTNRHINYSKDRILAPNASWTRLRLTHNNWTKNNTGESSGITKIVRAGIIIGGVFYQAKWGGATEKLMGEGLSITSDDIIIPQTAGGTNVTIRTKISYPLLFDTQTANFTVGQVVTGFTSGATGIIQSQSVDSGTTGELVLLSETGTFVNNELITDPLGGSALVNMAAQTTYSTIASQAIWLEGSISSQDSSIDYTIANPVSVRDICAAPTIVGGSITACGITAGTGYTNPSSVWAWQIGSDNILYSKNIGNTNFAHTSISITAGTPPEGLAAWDATVTVVTAGTDDFGANTAVYDACLLTGIPNTTVKTCLLLGDSISRGYSSTDDKGDIYHSYGFYERIIAQQCGIINMSTSGADYSNEILYASSFPKTYALYMGQATHALITLGSNDIAAGASAATVATRAGILSTYIRSFGTIVGYGNLLPRGDQVIITGISQAAAAVVTAANALVIGDTVTFSADVSGAGAIGGMTQIRGLTGTVTAANSTTFTVNIDSTAFSPYTSNGYAYILAVTTSQIAETGFALGGAADTYNANLGVGITSDFPVVHPRAVFQDSTVTAAWKTTSALTFDTIHPTQLGHTTAAANSTLIAELAFLGV